MPKLTSTDPSYTRAVPAAIDSTTAAIATIRCNTTIQSQYKPAASCSSCAENRWLTGPTGRRLLPAMYISFSKSGCLGSVSRCALWNVPLLGKLHFCSTDYPGPATQPARDKYLSGLQQDRQRSGTIGRLRSESCTLRHWARNNTRPRTTMLTHSWIS